MLAFGDSLYAGYGLARGQSLPDAIQARLRAEGINATLVNAGVSGDTSAAGRQRLASSLDNLKAPPDAGDARAWAATTCCASCPPRRRART